MAAYSVLATIRNYSGFTDRCAIAVATFAKYIINEATNVADHNRRFTWASSAILNPAGVVGQLSNAIVLDVAFANLTSTADFDAMTDAALQAVVEATINATLLAY